jgi:hypothetical protein
MARAGHDKLHRERRGLVTFQDAHQSPRRQVIGNLVGQGSGDAMPGACGEQGGIDLVDRQPRHQRDAPLVAADLEVPFRWRR